MAGEVVPIHHNSRLCVVRTKKNHVTLEMPLPISITYLEMKDHTIKARILIDYFSNIYLLSAKKTRYLANWVGNGKEHQKKQANDHSHFRSNFQSIARANRLRDDLRICPSKYIKLFLLHKWEKTKNLNHQLNK